MFRLFVAAIAPVLISVPAIAQEHAPAPDVTISGDVTLASDYRFRGMTYTTYDPVLQASITASHESGLYANVWASNLSDTPNCGELELDFAGGWLHEVAPGGTVDIGGGYYTYPNNRPGAQANFGEVFGRYSQAIGPVTATAGIAYAPKQASIGHRDNLYLSGDLRLDVPKTPVALTAHVGRTDGSLGPVNYLDWSLGATVSWGRAQFGVAYVDTDLAPDQLGRAGAVFSGKFTF